MSRDEANLVIVLCRLRGQSHSGYGVAELKEAGADLVFNLYTAAAFGFADHIFTVSNHSESAVAAG